MNRALVTAALLLLPLAAGAQTFTASLSADAVVPTPGPAGASGFATVTVDGTSVAYTILASGVEGITAAHIHDGATGATGGVVIDLDAAFVGGTAFGSVAADVAVVAAILADPAAFYVQVHASDFPAGALRGQLMGGGANDDLSLYLPVVAAAPGAGGTFFATDVRVVNRHDTAVDVTLEFYPDTAAGNSAPAATADITVAAHAEAVLDNIVVDTFGVASGKGGVRLVPSADVTALARIYNDQRAAGLGTFGQLSRAAGMDSALATGQVPFLSNQSAASGEGYRANLGWFNPSANPVELSFRAVDAGGSNLTTATVTVPAWSQAQTSVATLFNLASHGDFYVTFTATAPLFVYGSVVDNVNGDAIFVAAD